MERTWVNVSQMVKGSHTAAGPTQCSSLFSVAALISWIKDVRALHFFLHQCCLITFHCLSPLRKCIIKKKRGGGYHLSILTNSTPSVPSALGSDYINSSKPLCHGFSLY